jgi:hypothetical protein
MPNALRSLRVVSASLLAFASASASLGDRTSEALGLVPKDAIGFVIVPDVKRASDEFEQCLERMNRPQTAMLGRPIDQLKASLGIGGSFDDKGSIVLAALPPRTTDAKGREIPVEEREALFLALVPSIDPQAFFTSNFTPLPNVGPDAFQTRDGITVFGRPVGRHALVSNDRDVVAAYAPGGAEGIAAIRSAIGERGGKLIERADIVAWGGRAAIAEFLRTSAAQAERRVGEAEGMPFAGDIAAAQAKALELLAGLDGGLVAIDVDPLALGVRSLARFDPESDLGRLTKGGADRNASFSRLPPQAFYLALRVDIAGIGGLAAVESLLAVLPGAPALPDWLARNRDALRGLQWGIYPSRLGVAAGGILNDSVLFLETDRPDEVRTGVRDAILSVKGESNGVRREPAWEENRTLKSGETTDAFEVVETVVATTEGGTTDLAIQRAVAQAIFGSRGFVGFVKKAPGGVAMTFSQRADVLDRAMKIGVSPGDAGRSLADDRTLAAYRPWLIEGADVEGFVGVGQFGKLLQQLAGMVPGGEGIRLPEIATSIEPIALAAEIDGGSVETALVLPSGVLALFIDAAMPRAQPSQQAQPAASKPADGGGAEGR